MRKVAVMIYGRRPATAVDMVAGVAEFGAGKGWQLIVRSVEDPYLVPSMMRREVDGAIVMAQDQQQATELAKLNLPIVNVVSHRQGECCFD